MIVCASVNSRPMVLASTFNRFKHGCLRATGWSVRFSGCPDIGSGHPSRYRLRRIKADIVKCKQLEPYPPFYARGEMSSERAVEANAFFENVKVFEQIERMLANVEVRRSKVFSDIEGRRVDLAWQFRKASDNIIEGEFDESPDVRANAA
jgi:hypothetical protein